MMVNDYLEFRLSRTKPPSLACPMWCLKLLKCLDQLVIPHLLCARTEHLSDRVVAPACAPRAVCRSRRSVWEDYCVKDASRIEAAGEHPRRPAGSAGGARAGATVQRHAARSRAGLHRRRAARAEVSVVEVSTNDTRSLTSDERGSWVLPNLKPGTYRIVVSLDGFKTAAMDNVKLDVQGVRDVEVSLETGAVAETVTVSGQAAAVEVTSSTISQTIENKRMVDLPLNGRNPFSLATLAPGVAPTSTGGGSSPSISGGRNATSRGRHRRRLQRQRREQRLDPRPELHAVGRRRAGVQRPDQRRQRRVRPPRRRRHQPDHEERQQRAARHRLGVRAQRQDGRDQLLHQPRRRQEGRLQAQPVRRQRRRPDQQGQDVLLRELRRPPPGERQRPDLHRAAAGVAQRRLLELPQRLGTAHHHLRSADDARRSGQPGPVHPRSVSGQRHPAEPHQPDGARHDVLLAAAEHDADQPVHADQQLLGLGRVGQQRRPHRLPGRPHLQRPLAHLRPLLVLGRGRPAIQQLRQRGLVGRRRRPDLHPDTQPLGRPQLHARADLGAEPPLRPQPPLRRSPAAVGRLRPGRPELSDERHRHGRRVRVPARERAELPVAGPEHVHRSGDCPDDAQLQRERDQGVGHAHAEDGRRLPEVLAELHAAVLPVRPGQLQQRAVDAAQPQRDQRHAGRGAGLDAARRPERLQPEPQPGPGLGQLLLRRLPAGRLEDRPQLHHQPGPALRVRRAPDGALQPPRLLRRRRALASGGGRAGEPLLRSVAAEGRGGVHRREQPPAGRHRLRQHQPAPRLRLELRARRRWSAAATASSTCRRTCRRPATPAPRG